MNRKKTPLIIPVESQVRELDAKLLLACVAAERGFPVIIGSRAFIHFKVDAIEKGIYLAKSMRKLSIRMFDILRRLGHEIVAMDEEGLLRGPDSEYYRWRLSPRTMNQISHLIAWGRDDAETFRNYPDYCGTPIHIAGNPRIDLMRKELRAFYQPRVDHIRNRFNNLILINTNFSKINHFYPELSPLKDVLDDRKSRDVPSFDAEWGRQKKLLFDHFRTVLPKIAELAPDAAVVIRPHPAENHAPWLAIAERCKNMHVANEGTVTPWLMASKVVIANSCTTQVEAAVLGVPSISFQPVVSETDHWLPNAVSHQTSSEEELCGCVRAVLNDGLGPLDEAVRRSTLAPHIAALDGPLAADRIVDVLEKIEFGEGRSRVGSLSDYVTGWTQNRLRTAVKHVNMHRPGHRNNLAYHAHRWPDVSVEEVREKIKQLGALLNRFDSVRVTQYSKHIFKIEG